MVHFSDPRVTLNDHVMFLVKLRSRVSALPSRIWSKFEDVFGSGDPA